MNYGKVKYLIFLLLLIFLGYFLSQVFSGNVILSQAFFVGPLAIHYYGLIMALAVGAGFYLAIKRATGFGISKSSAEDFLFWVIIGGFIGARLYHIMSSLEYYIQNPINIIKVWNGGLSIYGALIGGVIIILYLSKSYKPRLQSPEAQADGGQVKAISLLDWLAPSLILGQIIGRFGNLFNYEAYGYPTSVPWKMFVPQQFRPETYIAQNYFHPFFLYEVLGSLFILGIIYYISRFRTQQTGKYRIFANDGTLFFSYVLLYNSLRFCLEFLRIDSTFIGVFRLNAIISLVLVLLAVGGFFALNYKCSRDTN